MPGKELIDKSVTNIFWSYVSFFSTKVLNLVALVVLARFLPPAEFGLMAFCIVIIGYFEMFSRFGLGAAVISAREDVDAVADAVFWFALVLASSMAAVVWVSAGAFGEYFGQPELADILPVLSLSMVFVAFSAVHNSLLQKELRFRARILPDVVRGLVKGLLSIALAILGFGVWSLVYGYVAGSLAFTFSLLIIRPWRPKGLPRREPSIGAIRFGAHLFVAEFIAEIPRSLDALLIGKILGPGPLGIYALAVRIPNLAIKTFSMVAGRVIHPIMAQMQTDDRALRDYYYGCLRYFTLLTLPVGTALAVLSEPLVHVLFTPEWNGMIRPMQFLSIAFALGTLNLLPGTIYKAINRTDYLLRVSLITLPFIVVLLWLAVPRGIDATAMAQIIIVIVAYVPNQFLLHKVIGITLRATLLSLAPGVFCAAAAAAAGLAAQQLVSAPDLAQLAFVAAASLAGYLVALRVAGPEVLAEASRFLIAARRAA